MEHLTPSLAQIYATPSLASCPTQKCSSQKIFFCIRIEGRCLGDSLQFGIIHQKLVLTLSHPLFYSDQKIYEDFFCIIFALFSWLVKNILTRKTSLSSSIRMMITAVRMVCCSIQYIDLCLNQFGPFTLSDTAQSTQTSFSLKSKILHFSEHDHDALL